MKSFLLKPIGRRTYFVGLIVLWLASMALGMLNFGISYMTSSSSSSLLIMLIIIFANLVWDYKRIIDISLNPSYKFLLSIPVVTILLPAITGAGFGIILNGGLTSAITAFGVLSLIKLLYRLFLIFKKGSIESTTIPTPTSSTIPTPSIPTIPTT